jgi:hypothetical protein
MTMQNMYVKAIVLLCLVGLVTAIGTNEISTSTGDLLLNSSNGNVNVTATLWQNGVSVYTSAGGALSNSATVTGDVNATGKEYAPTVLGGGFVGVGSATPQFTTDNAAGAVLAIKHTVDANGYAGISFIPDNNATQLIQFYVNPIGYGINGLVLYATTATDGSISPYVNNSYTLGRAGLLWGTIYAHTSVTGDTFYNGDPDYLIREVERPGEGLAKEYIPKSLVADCPDSSVTVQTTDLEGNTITRPELDTECWSRIGDENWDNLNHITDTYDGDVITSDGVSVREMNAVKQVLEDKGVLTEADISTKVQQIKQAATKGGLNKA